ncbi:MAG: hypothetical protein LQ352_002079 [Teloschistes flavicans]|nr:MAG: hypothetical protein LQ352_002079 [Teloschistes flavicans]
MEEPTSPTASVSASDGSENDPAESQDGPWASHIDPASTFTDQANSSDSHKPAPTMPKRRRVTRAYCTYDQPSNRRRNPPPQYVEKLERRLRRAELLLRNVLPNVDLDDPSYDAAATPQLQVKQETDISSSGFGVAPQIRSSPSPAIGEAEKEALLESMVHEAGSLDLDDQGHWDFYGQSSGMVFLRRMREQFGDLLGKPEDSGKPFTKSSNISSRLSSPTSANGSPSDRNSIRTHDLPAKACAQKLCSCALDDAASLLRFVHQPTFYMMFDRAYDVPQEQLTSADQKFLPLFYSVIALGCLFAKAEQSMLQSYGYESAAEQGFKWFQVSRQLMDATDCRDLVSLQTLLFMIMFLQASAKLSTCYSHIGIALRSAVRMGLHRSVSNQFCPIEKETRKRTFWVIRNMDIYVGALLGLPIMLSDDDIDQEFPLEVDDACITSDGILPMLPGKTPLMAAFNAHVRLVKIMAKTVRYIYPLHTMRSKTKHAYVVHHSKIREVEQDMQRWMEELPMALRPGGDTLPDLLRVQQLLRMSYAHIQIILYRPFLHYASPSTQAMITDKRTYACAAACVSVSRNVVHITSEMKRSGLLTGAYWFSMYTTFFAILSLLFYAIENPQNTTSEVILRDAHEGRDTLAKLSPSSMAADRSSQTLARLFEQLPEALRTGRLKSVSVPAKKRSAPSKNPAPREPSPLQNTGTNKNQVQSPSDRSGTSDWSLTSQSYNSPLPLPPRQSMPNTDLKFRENPQQALSPTVSSTRSYQQHNPPPGSLPPSGTQAIFPGLQSPEGPGFPDLSTMMFPSNDPFAYPNQPMMTLENYGGGTLAQSFSAPAFSVPTNSESYDNFNAPYFGPLPSYSTSGIGQNANMADSRGESQSTNIDSGQRRIQDPQQGRFGTQPPGTGWGAMFGEDWSGGWADHGYGT